MDTLSEKVHQAIGEASMCWSEIPKGVFNSTRAIEIADELIEAIEERIAVAEETEGR